MNFIVGGGLFSWLLPCVSLLADAWSLVPCWVLVSWIDGFTVGGGCFRWMRLSPQMLGPLLVHHMSCWFWLVGLGFLAGSGWFVCACQAGSAVVLLQVCFGCLSLGLSRRLFPLCSLSWYHGFQSVGWGSLPNCLGYCYSVLYRSSTSMLVWLEEIRGSFLLSITSKWRVQDGDCPSINQVKVVVQTWSSGDDVQIVHYPSVAW